MHWFLLLHLKAGLVDLIMECYTNKIALRLKEKWENLLF